MIKHSKNFCEVCGEKIEDDAAYCIGCGRSLLSKQQLKSLSDNEILRYLPFNLNNQFKEANENIYHLVIACALWDILITVVAILSNQDGAIYGLIDAVLVLILTAGVFFLKSRIFGVILCVYIVINFGYNWLIAGQTNGWWLVMILSTYVYQGVVGTFTYHKIRNSLIGDA